jgi:hypothetical protein
LLRQFAIGIPLLSQPLTVDEFSVLSMPFLNLRDLADQRR